MRSVHIPIDGNETGYLSALNEEELLSTSSGLGKGRNGLSLVEALKDFLKLSPVAQQAQESMEVAEEHAALMAERLYAYLRANEFEDVDLLMMHGFDGKLVEASPFIEEGIRAFGHNLVAKDIIHFAVRVGNIVIDLGFKRFGKDYMHSNNAVFNAYKRHWKKVSLVPNANRMSRTDFLGLVRKLVNATDLKRRFDDLKSKATGKDERGIPVTASAVVDAFSGAKRNRKLRGVTRDGNRLKITI